MTLLSTMFSGLTFNLIPAQLDYHTRHDVKGVRLRTLERLPTALQAKGLRSTSSAERESQLKDESLTDAARDGRLQEVRQLLRAGAHANASGSSCPATPLTLAAAGGHARVVALLLENGATFTHPIFCQESQVKQAIDFLRRSPRSIAEMKDDKARLRFALMDPNRFDRPRHQTTVSAISNDEQYNPKLTAYVLLPLSTSGDQEFVPRPASSDNLHHYDACIVIVGDGDCETDYHTISTTRTLARWSYQPPSCCAMLPNCPTMTWLVWSSSTLQLIEGSACSGTSSPQATGTFLRS